MAVDLSFDVGRRQVPTNCHGILEQSGYKSGHFSREEVLQPAQACEAVGINGQRHRGREEAAKWESSVSDALAFRRSARARVRGSAQGEGGLKGGGQQQQGVRLSCCCSSRRCRRRCIAVGIPSDVGSSTSFAIYLQPSFCLIFQKNNVSEFHPKATTGTQRERIKVKYYFNRLEVH